MNPGDLPEEEEDEETPSELTDLSQLAWTSCEGLAETAGPDEACAEVVLPLRRDVEGTGTVSILLRRLGPEEPVDGEIWLLGGGPGNATEIYSGQIEQLATLAPGHTVYLVGHRGTVGSSFLDCRAFDTASTWDELATKCYQQLTTQWGEEGLVGFSSTEAAQDVIELARRRGEPADDLVIYGISYGAVWANRIVSLDPDLASAVVYDSPATARRAEHFVVGFVQGHEVARAVLDACGEDADCGERLGPDPMERALEAVGSGCLLDNATLRANIEGSLEFAETRALLPALVSRVERCSEEDEDAVLAWSEYLDLRFEESEHGAPWDWYGQPLFYHMLSTERFERPSTAEEILAFTQGEIGVWSAVEGVNTFLETWESEPADSWPEEEWASDQPDVLVLYSERDRRTGSHPAHELEEVLGSGTGRTFVEMPDASHSMLNSGRQPDGVVPCTEDLLTQFINARQTPVDTSCTADLAAVPFADADAAALVFGLDQAWPD